MYKLTKITGVSLILFGFLLLIGCEDKITDEDHQVTVTLKILQNDAEVTTVAANEEAELIFEVIEGDDHDGHGAHISGLSPHMEIGDHGGMETEIEIHAGTEDGHYEGHHTFTEAGTYEVHFSFHHDGADMEDHFDVTVQ